MLNKSKKTMLAFSALSLISGTAFASTVLINDDFASGTAADNGYFGWSSSSAAVAWVRDTGTLRNTDDSSPGVTMLKSFTPVTLSAVGDSIELSLRYRNLQTSGIGGEMRIGLYNVESAITSSQIGLADPRSGKDGVFLFQAHGGAGISANLVTSGSASALPDPVTSNDFTGGAPLNTNRAWVDFAYTLTKTSTGLLWEISSVTDDSSDDNQNVATSREFAWSGDFTIDTFSILGSWVAGSGTRFTMIDDVSLTYTPIPELSSMSLLLGLSALGLLVRRRPR